MVRQETPPAPDAMPTLQWQEFTVSPVGMFFFNREASWISKKESGL
jgi:hypothetical protein